MKIRIGNDFVFNWAIERGGLPEDLSSVLEKHLHLSVFGKRVELTEGVDYDITGNVIRIEVTPAIANIIGTYKVEFHYILPDNGFIDEDRKCEIDVDAFQIVAKTAQADDSAEFSMTSDMAIAFKGDKGDSAYQVWLEEGNTGTEEDYFAYLRQPAIDAGASISELEGEIQVSEGLRVQAESERVNAEGDATKGRVKAENERVAAEGERAQAFEQMMGEADDKIEEMDTTLSTYDGRVTQAESDISQLAGELSDSTEKAGAASLSELNARLLALEKIVSATITNKLEVTKEFNVWGKTNLILTGSGAATFAPDFIGQKYIDTTGRNIYVAVGVATAGNWKLV